MTHTACKFVFLISTDIFQASTLFMSISSDSVVETESETDIITACTSEETEEF